MDVNPPPIISKLATEPEQLISDPQEIVVLLIRALTLSKLELMVPLKPFPVPAVVVKLVMVGPEKLIVAGERATSAEKRGHAACP